MTLDGFLTVLALIAAVYAVLTPVQRLKLSLFWPWQLLLAAPACAAILFLELYQPNLACRLSSVSLCAWLSFGPAPQAAGKTAFLIAAAWLASAIAIHRFARPMAANAAALCRVATGLLDEERYGEAIELLSPQLKLLAATSRRRSSLQRLHDWLAGFGSTDRGVFALLAQPPGARPRLGDNWPDAAARPFRWLANLVPSHRRAEQAASDLFQHLFNATQLFDYVASRRPYFGLRLIAQDVFGAGDFSEKYLGRLIAEPTSLLYQELATADGIDGLLGYKLLERNRLLHYLFADAQNAERLSAWQAVGDYLVRLVNGSERPGYRAWLNSAPRDFEAEKMRDPLYMGLFYFSLMVTSAARQGVGYHMWLFYLRTIAAGLADHYDSTGDEVDRDAEFPVRVARLLYELFHYLTQWIGMFEHLPESSFHRRFPEKPDRVATVPHAAGVTLGRALASVIRSDRLDTQVKATLLEVAIRAVRALHPDNGEISRMRAWLIDALLDSAETSPRAFWSQLQGYYGLIDLMLRYEVQDFTEALSERLARPAGQQ